MWPMCVGVCCRSACCRQLRKRAPGGSPTVDWHAVELLTLLAVLYNLHEGLNRTLRCEYYATEGGIRAGAHTALLKHRIYGGEARIVELVLKYRNEDRLEGIFVTGVSEEVFV